MRAGAVWRIMAAIPLPKELSMLLILILAAAGTLIPSALLSIADRRPRSAS
jgi:hypothetical protein